MNMTVFASLKLPWSCSYHLPYFKQFPWRRKWAHETSILVYINSAVRMMQMCKIPKYCLGHECIL